jgi:hypothetical protein
MAALKYIKSATEIPIREKYVLIQVRVCAKDRSSFSRLDHHSA